MLKEFFKNVFEFFKLIFFILFLIFIFVLGLAFIIIIFNGKIYIEILIIFFLIYIFICWKIWFYFSKRKLIKKYDPEKDLGRLAEENKKRLLEENKKRIIDNGKARQGGTFSEAIAGADTTAGDSDTIVSRLGELKERQLLPKANVSDAGKNRKGIRKFFGRKRRR